MNNNIFIPKKINVGFQEREDTYTGKLSYIIYFDEKGKLRKEASWNNWRNKNIDNIIFENVPTEGFVINKHVGGYSSGWNHRNSYIRIYDPRDFEFEISVENLLYILENCTSEKGKGLIGQFIYGWDGKDLVLISCNSPDYKEIKEYNQIVHENKSIKAKDLIIGATYKTKNNEELIYMGKFDEYNYTGESEGKKFWFYNREASYTKFETMKTIPKNKFIHIVNSDCCNDYAGLFNELECYYHYSPIDESRDEYKYYELDYFKEVMNEVLSKNYWWSGLRVYCDLGDNILTVVTIERKDKNSKDLLKATKKLIKIEKHKTSWSFNEYEREVKYDELIMETKSLEELFKKLKPQYKNIYLKNGKLKGGKENNEQY
ncbi:TPA: hypothetical protein ACXDAZ_002575 [Clostridium botulinum]